MFELETQHTSLDSSCGEEVDGEGEPEVLVHLVLAFAINLFPDYEVRGVRRQLLDELETRPARSSDAG